MAGGVQFRFGLYFPRGSIYSGFGDVVVDVVVNEDGSVDETSSFISGVVPSGDNVVPMSRLLSVVV